MKIHHLKPAPGAHKDKVRVGRGEGGRRGKTAGRGTKGTGARGTVPAGFEGGQMPLQRRLPKLPGFTPRSRVAYVGVNVAKLDAMFADGDAVTPESLRERGLVRRSGDLVKILGNGDLAKKLQVSAHAFSESARAKIDGAGGSVTVLPAKRAGGSE